MAVSIPRYLLAALSLLLLVALSHQRSSHSGPIVIAHRGASATAPENTIPAFKKALEEGSDGFETDLRTSKDGVVVLIHDSTVNRTTNCSSTAPPGQCRCGPVNDLTLAELKTCDAGSWKGPEFAGTRIPTFQEAVELASEHDAVIVMDLKTDDVTGGLLGKQIIEIVTPLVMNTNVLPSCWNADQLQNMRLYLRQSAKQKLGSAPAEHGRQYFADVISAGVGGFSVDYKTTTQSFVYDAHKRMLPVFVWTVNGVENISNVIEMGVDGILSDEPDVVLQLIGA
eukprot:TRINITY_DN118_c1_g1_i1.p1 TRINITY_DN118_c1_g1~~TRINITY_DN118_c1_g1_i1.p1  ORF type:complete len:283 (+),score=95.89 TRINITY_DN118_c1_g1_i1:73-921(+)